MFITSHQTIVLTLHHEFQSPSHHLRKSFATWYEWAAEFKCGRASFVDDESLIDDHLPISLWKTSKKKRVLSEHRIKIRGKAYPLNTFFNKFYE